MAGCFNFPSTPCCWMYLFWPAFSCELIMQMMKWSLGRFSAAQGLYEEQPRVGGVQVDVFKDSCWVFNASCNTCLTYPYTAILCIYFMNNTFRFTYVNCLFSLRCLTWQGVLNPLDVSHVFIWQRALVSICKVSEKLEGDLANPLSVTFQWASRIC